MLPRPVTSLAARPHRQHRDQSHQCADQPGSSDWPIVREVVGRGQVKSDAERVLDLIASVRPDEARRSRGSVGDWRDRRIVERRGVGFLEVRRVHGQPPFVMKITGVLPMQEFIGAFEHWHDERPEHKEQEAHQPQKAPRLHRPTIVQSVPMPVCSADVLAVSARLCRGAAALYSARSAVSGSTRIARRAGM